MSARVAIGMTLAFGVACSGQLSVRASPASGAARTVRIDGTAGRELAEADLAVDPAAPNRVIVVAKDLGGLYRAIDAYRSSDGGAHFRGGPLVSGRYLGVPADATDPVIAYGDHGAALSGALVWRYPGNGFDALIGVQRSTDGGATFGRSTAAANTHNRGRPTIFLELLPGSTTYDKDWVAVDRTRGPREGAVYATWIRLRVRRSGPSQSVVQVAASRDRGRRFSHPVTISDINHPVAGPRVAIEPDGAVLVVWSSFRHTRRESTVTVLAARSRNGARAFSRPVRIGAFHVGPSLGLASDESANQLVALDVTSAGDRLVCWLQGAGPAASQTACIRSSDGVRWSSSVPVAPGVGGIHALAQVAADGPHGFDVTFYAEGRRSTDVLLARSRDRGATFGQAQVLAHRSYPVSSLVGDYTGLAAAGGKVFAAYILPRSGPGSNNSIYIETR